MITGFSHAVQISVLLKSIGTGYFLGLVFSAVMFFNAFYSKHTVTVFIRDILFFVSAAFFTFLFVLKYNAGTVRFYILAGEGIGFCLFYIFPGQCAGKFFRKTAEKISEKANNLRLKIKRKTVKIKGKMQEKLKNKKTERVKGKENKKRKKPYKNKMKKRKKAKIG